MSEEIGIALAVLLVVLNFSFVYLLIGTVLVMDALVHLRAEGKDNLITLGRIAGLMLLWLPKFIILSYKEK